MAADTNYNVTALTAIEHDHKQYERGEPLTVSFAQGKALYEANAVAVNDDFKEQIEAARAEEVKDGVGPTTLPADNTISIGPDFDIVTSQPVGLQPTTVEEFSNPQVQPTAEQIAAAIGEESTQTPTE